MKTKALNNFRAKLAKGETVYGLWVTSESASTTDIAVALGLDWVVIDAEHGHLDWKDINEHIRAGLRSDTVILVRIQERSTSLSKRVLDMGADGIVIPGVENHLQLQEAVRDCHYPPSGRRGMGGERATVWGQCLNEHAEEANTNVLVIPIIEQVSAIPHIQEMCNVEGVDTFFFGPADFSASAGFAGQWEGPGVAEQIIEIKDILISRSKYCGVMATNNENLLNRKKQGFRMLGIGSDSALLLRSIRGILDTVGRDKKPKTSLDPRN
jgi:2-keto-3-deoxy-L-rhamnonate aldolase RhmA